MHYTKAELMQHKDGWYALALSVVKQWIKDGKPQADAKYIQGWIGICNQYEEFRHKDIASTTTSVQKLLL